MNTESSPAPPNVPIRSFFLDLFKRSSRVIISGLFTGFSLIYTLWVVSRLHGAAAVGAMSVAFTALSVILVLGAGQGISLMHGVVRADSGRAKSRVVRTQLDVAGRASQLLMIAWVIAAATIIGLGIVPRDMFIAVWAPTAITFFLSPQMSCLSSLLQARNEEKRLFTNSLRAFIVDVLAVTVVALCAQQVDFRISLFLLGLASETNILSVLILNLRHTSAEFSKISTWVMDGLTKPSASWRDVVRTSSAVWDGLAVMLYYLLWTNVTARSSLTASGTLGVVASINRSIIVPLKSVGMVAGRVVKVKAFALSTATLARVTLFPAMALLPLGALLILFGGQFGRLFGLSPSESGLAFRIAGVQLCLECLTGFILGFGKIIVKPNFGVSWAIFSIAGVALPASAILVLSGLSLPIAALGGFLIGRIFLATAFGRYWARHRPSSAGAATAQSKTQ